MTDTTTDPTQTAPHVEHRASGRDGQRRGMDPLFGVRTADIEPYTGLRYLSKLFKMIAVVLIVALVAETIIGLYQQGRDALVTLLSEVSKLIVTAAALWGLGDLALLLIDVGHDVRAARILIGRQTAHLTHHPHEAQVAGPSAAREPRVGDVRVIEARPAEPRVAEPRVAEPRVAEPRVVAQG